MASMQGQFLKLMYRLKLLVSPLPKVLDVEKERAALEATTKKFKPVAKLKTEHVDVNGVPGEWITPPRVAGGGAILYLHGGYFTFGSIQTHRSLAGNIATAAQRRTLIIDYRLAPEHPFPAALDDSCTAYSWLLEQGTQPEQVVLAGDSAGGGLVLSVLLTLRDQGAALPAAGVCLSPVTDLTLSGESWKSNVKKDLVINTHIIKEIISQYLSGEDPRSPVASPLFADLDRLPPLLIQVGSTEVLLSDSTRFAERAREAGVDITLEIWPDVPHVWQIAASILPEARKAVGRIGEYITQVTG